MDRGSRHRCRDTCRPHDLLGRQVVGERPLRELPLLGLPERAAHGHVGLSRRLTSIRRMTAIGAQLPVLQASVALKLPLARHQPASAHSRWGSRLFAPGSIRVRDRKIVIPKKTGRPVQFEITEQARTGICEWLSDWPGKAGAISSRAVSGSNRTSRRDSTRASFINGWTAPIWIVCWLDEKNGA